MEQLGRQSVVVVTGASQGIGRGVTGALLDAGYAVLGVDVREIGFGPQSQYAHLRADIRDPAVVDLILEAASELGVPAALVNNAALSRESPLLELDDDLLNEITDLNLLSAVRLSRGFIREWLNAGTPGRIVNVSSIHATRSFAGWSAYAMAKGGLESFTRALCAEFARCGICCNAVAPGAVETENALSLIEASPNPSGYRRALEALSPARRLASVEEVAAVVRWLICDAPSFVNGQVIHVDGGATSVTQVEEG